jgi:hypothetical protein
MDLSFEVDDRQPPDHDRKREFRKGWEHSLRNGVENEYTDKTLKKLTWNNLGYRLGRLFGNTPDEMREELYEWSVRHYQTIGPVK